jgi:hypothetical protein
MAHIQLVDLVKSIDLYKVRLTFNNHNSIDTKSSKPLV